MIRRTRAVLWLVRGLSTISILSFLSLAGVEALSLWTPNNVPLLEAWIFVTLAGAAAVLALLAHGLDVLLARRSRRD